MQVVPMPNVTLLMKLGSIVVHADELLSPDGHDVDRSAIEGLLKDAEVTGWIESMTALSLLPLKRTAVKRKPRKKS